MAMEEFVQKRRNEVRRLLARGRSRQDIMSALFISEKTLGRDLRAIRTETRFRSTEDLNDQIITQFLIEASEVKRELWLLYDKSKNEQTKTKLLATISRHTSDTLDTCIRLGFKLHVESTNPNNFHQTNPVFNIMNRIMEDHKEVLEKFNEEDEMEQKEFREWKAEKIRKKLRTEGNA